MFAVNDKLSKKCIIHRIHNTTNSVSYKRHKGINGGFERNIYPADKNQTVLSEIASMAGFKNEFCFSFVFRKKYTSPQKFSLYDNYADGILQNSKKYLKDI